MKAQARKYMHMGTGVVAEYDSFMSLYYVKGKEERPYANWELEDSPDWEVLSVFPMYPSTVVPCECHGHKLEHEYDEDDNFHYINFWTHGVEGDKPSFGRRFAEAWRVLTGKKTENFWGVVLNDENAQKIARSIQEKKDSI